MPPGFFALLGAPTARWTGQRWGFFLSPVTWCFRGNPTWKLACNTLYILIYKLYSKKRWERSFWGSTFDFTGVHLERWRKMRKTWVFRKTLPFMRVERSVPQQSLFQVPYYPRNNEMSNPFIMKTNLWLFVKGRVEENDLLRRNHTLLIASPKLWPFY